MNFIDENDNKKNCEFLFDPNFLYSLDYKEAYSHCGLSPDVSPDNPGKNLLLRPLHLRDFDKGFLELLSELTVVDTVSMSAFQKRFQNMQNCLNTYYVTVIENVDSQKVIAAATLVIEQKFIHKAALRGRIEDVVVKSDFRGQKLGNLLLATLTLLGRQLGCYKISLECKDKLIGWYETFGYKNEVGNNYMIQRFEAKT